MTDNEVMIARLEAKIDEIIAALGKIGVVAADRPNFQCAACGEMHYALDQFEQTEAYSIDGLLPESESSEVIVSASQLRCKKCGSRCYPADGQLPKTL